MELNIDFPSDLVARLDKWYAERFRTYYTKEVEKEFVEFFISKYKENEIELETLSIAINTFSVENQISSTANYFSEYIRGLSFIRDGLSNPQSKLYIEEYFESIVNSMGKFQEIMRTLMAKKQSDLEELTDEVINQTFTHVFGSLDCYAHFVKSCKEGIFTAFDPAVSMGSVNREQADKIMAFLNLCEEKGYYLYKKLFGDLFK